MEGNSIFSDQRDRLDAVITRVWVVDRISEEERRSALSFFALPTGCGVGSAYAGAGLWERKLDDAGVTTLL